MIEKTFPKVSGEGLHPSEANSLQIVNVEASENLTAGNIAYIKKNDGKAYLSDTGTAGDIRANGIVLDTVTSGNTANIQVGGNYVTSGLTAAEVYYLGASGAVSTTRSAIEIGVATSTTNLYIKVVQDDADPIGTIKHVAANITGVPTYNISAFWHLMDGTALTGGSADAESPLNGQTLRDLNANHEFLRSADTSGGTGGRATSGTASQDHGAEAGFSYQPGSEDNQPPFYDVVAIIKYK